MTTFLSTIVVLSMLVVGGYSLNMYLYAQGVVGIRSRNLRRVRSFKREANIYGEGRWEEDYGLRYARTGILLIVGVLIAMLVVLVVVLSAFLH